MTELEIFASFVLFAGGDCGSVCNIERSVVSVGDAMSPSCCPESGGGEGERLVKKVRDKFGRQGSLPVVGLSPAKEAMVKGAKEEGGEEERDGVQGELC